jgi:hypothetical protein
MGRRKILLLFDLSTKQKELEELDYWEMGMK